jgi:hypothetical protein
MNTPQFPLARRARAGLSVLLLVLIGCLVALLPFVPAARPAYAAAHTAGSFAELEAAINAANASAEDDTITLTADITLGGALFGLLGATLAMPVTAMMLITQRRMREYRWEHIGHSIEAERRPKELQSEPAE